MNGNASTFEETIKDEESGRSDYDVVLSKRMMGTVEMRFVEAWPSAGIVWLKTLIPSQSSEWCEWDKPVRVVPATPMTIQIDSTCVSEKTGRPAIELTGSAVATAGTSRGDGLTVRQTLELELVGLASDATYELRTTSQYHDGNGMPFTRDGIYNAGSGDERFSDELRD